jgi:hypothetical protein
MCRQPLEQKIRTIENVLFEAMVAAGAISPDNADDPNKVRMRSLHPIYA